jgi:tetratricopeptide (TPR) repeat protein
MKKLRIFLPVLISLMSVPHMVGSAWALGDRAMEYFNLGLKSSMAYKKIDYFSKALELNPRFAPAYEKRGLHYYFQEKYDKVIEDFTRYIRLVPDKADAYQMLGMAYLKIGSYDKAIVNFDNAVKFDPKMSAAFGFRAEALRLNGKLSEAMEDATTAIEMGGDLRNLADAYKTRGKVYLAMNEDSQADADFKKSIDLDPRLIFYRYFSSYASLDAMRKAGLVGMVGIAFVLVFGLKLKPPDKDE